MPRRREAPGAVQPKGESFVRSQISTRRWYRMLALLLGLALVAAACGGDDDDGNDGAAGDPDGQDTSTTEPVDEG